MSRCAYDGLLGVAAAMRNLGIEPRGDLWHICRMVSKHLRKNNNSVMNMLCSRFGATSASARPDKELSSALNEVKRLVSFFRSTLINLSKTCRTLLEALREGFLRTANMVEFEPVDVAELVSEWAVYVRTTLCVV